MEYFEKKDRTKYLLKNTAIFTIGNISSKLMSFFLVPLYTKTLNTSEYGTLDLITTICTMVLPILTLNIGESVLRFNLDKDANRDAIAKIGILIVCTSLSVGVCIIPISNSIPILSDYSLLIYLYVILAGANQIFLCDLRGKEYLILYSIGNLLNAILTAFFNIIFLIFLQWNLKGYLLACILSNLFVSVYSIFVGQCYKSLFYPIDKYLLKNMLRYSLVLIPNSLMWWIMNSSDRVMVTNLLGSDKNGIYAISYKLPTTISLFASFFNQAWQYSAIKEAGARDEVEYSNQVLKYLTASAMFTGVCLLITIKPFLKIYVPKEYYEAWEYTPFLTIGCIFLAISTFLSTSYTINKDGFGFLISGAVGACINIILNFLLIPEFKLYGVAVATCMSYITVFVFRSLHTRQYIKYEILNKEFIIGTVFLLISSLMMFLDGIWPIVVQTALILTELYLFKFIWIPILAKVKIGGRNGS